MIVYDCSKLIEDPAVWEVFLTKQIRYNTVNKAIQLREC